MLRYLLATNVISEPVRPDPSEAVIRQLEDRSGEIALPSVAWHELIYGAVRMDEGARRTYLIHYLREVVEPAMPILPYDAAAAQWHGRSRAALEAKGRSVPFADGQIAAIAGSRDLIVVTRNTDDFAPFQSQEEGLEGIHVENWFDT